MQLPNSSRQPDVVTLEAAPRAARAGASVTARVARMQTGLAARIADTAWSAIHAMGAHRWRDGYETDPERGMSRYRGTRCTVCDEPWEGW
jgi:hypothetical protein